MIFFKGGKRMSHISPEQIKQIRSSVDIVDVVSRYVPLTPKGKNHFGICPFHDDNNPSMSVSREKQIYTCFSCGATGNVIHFVENYEHVSFVEALKILAAIAGIPLQITDYQQIKTIRNQELYDIYEISNKFYHNNIYTVEGKKAKEYLKKRNIDDALIKEFEIGLAFKKNDLLSKLLVGKKFTREHLLKSGLLNETNNGYSDIYYNRIMFPLWDITGKVVGFSGRIYNGEKETSKYINTRETEIFKKRELLYHYHKAKEEARKNNTLIVMEGFMDVIRAHTIGITNVVATMGTAVTKEQANLMKRAARDIILCFDGDEAGAKATFACGGELEKIGVSPKVVRLPEKLDPDEFILQYGKERFLDYIDHPILFMDFKLSYFKKEKDLTTNEGMASYIKEMILEINKIDDDVLRQVTLQKLSNETKLSLAFLEGKIEKKSPKEIPTFHKEGKKGYDKYEKAQMYLLYYMMQSEEVIDWYLECAIYIPIQEYRILGHHIVYFYQKYGKIESADLITELDKNPKIIETMGKIEQLSLKSEYTKEEIEDYLQTIKEYNVKQGILDLRKQLQMETSLEKRMQILDQIRVMKQ